MIAGALLPVLALSCLGVRQDPQRWEVQTIRGERFTGAVRIGADGDVQVEHDGGTATLTLDELLRVDRTGGAVEQLAADPRRLWLRSGVELPFAGVTGSGRRFGVTVPFASERLSVELPYVAAIRLSADPVQTDFEAQLTDPGDSSDYLYLIGDQDRTVRLSAKVLGLGPEALAIELSGQQREVPWERLYGVIFARDSGAAPDRQPGPRARLELRQDARLEGRLISLDGFAELRLDEGSGLRIDARNIRSIRLASDRLAYLSDLEPAVQEQVPALDRTWPWIADRSPRGDAIRLGGREYEKGLVLFPRTRLTYDLSGRFDFFEAVIGIEDRAGPEAHAVFRVLADDELLFESEPFVLGSEPQPLRLPVDSANRLTIEADFGNNLDLGDHCVFADARVVRGQVP